MSEKTYTPFEVAIKVLDKVKELAKAESIAIEKGDLLQFPKKDSAIPFQEKKVKNYVKAPDKVDEKETTFPASKNFPKKDKNKLEQFMDKKKAKKTKQIEKALGMQGPAKPAGSPGSSPLAPKPPKMAAPAIGIQNKKV